VVRSCLCIDAVGSPKRSRVIGPASVVGDVAVNVIAPMVTDADVIVEARYVRRKFALARHRGIR